jgi:two-component system, LytTR family, sensor kinase
LQKDLSVIARFKIAILGWAAASVFFTAVLVLSDFGHKPLGFALYSNAIHFGLWALALPLLTKAIHAFPLRHSRRIRNASVILLVVVALAMMIVAVHWAIVFATYFPERGAYTTFRSFFESELIRFLPFDILVGIVLVVALEGWRVLRDFQTERMRAVDLERQLAVSRVEALRMQLHPHFLFNTLHTIAGLTVEDPPTARRMVIALGDLLRSTLKDSGTTMRTLAEELEFSDLYLGIEKLRLGDRLVLNYELGPEAARAEVPTLLLQPLFENAVQHGAARVVGSCEICFRSSRKESHLHLTISNDGPKRAPSSAAPRFGVGLTNTRDRLRLHYGDAFTLEYRDRPQGGAQIDIFIPYRQTEQKNTGDLVVNPTSTESDTCPTNVSYIVGSAANGTVQKG